VIYDVRHVTTYTYGAPIISSRCTLRLMPRSGPGQEVLACDLIITPHPAHIAHATCFFGNTLSAVTIETPHKTLSFDARFRITVDRPEPPMPSLCQSWEDLREEAFASRDLGPASPAQFLFPSRLVPLVDSVTRYAKESFYQGRPALEGAVELMGRIRADFAYDPKATQVSTPLAKAFAQRRGVCQDFAHIMIAGLRGLGLPASYVSGYLRTIPPAGKPRLEGADATHAWVQLWCGGGLGAVGLDPTNDMMIGDDHIILAHGRDYADISPVDGIIIGSREQDVDVKVDVVPVG